MESQFVESAADVRGFIFSAEPERLQPQLLPDLLVGYLCSKLTFSNTFHFLSYVVWSPAKITLTNNKA